MAKTTKTTKTAKTATTVPAKTAKGKGAKSAPVAKSAIAVAVERTPRKTWHDDAKEPKNGQTVMDACIELMRRPGGCGITDFQTIKGFNLPSMAVVRAAEKRGYKATASKVAGERTVYKATGSASKSK